MILAALAEDSITVGTSAVGLTRTNLPGVTHVEITLEGGPIRYLTTGSDPAAGGPGTLIYDGGTKGFDIFEATRLRMIGDPVSGATLAATVRVRYRGPR